VKNKSVVSCSTCKVDDVELGTAWINFQIPAAWHRQERGLIRTYLMIIKHEMFFLWVPFTCLMIVDVGGEWRQK
jgi:hypothetical protein